MTLAARSTYSMTLRQNARPPKPLERESGVHPERCQESTQDVHSSSYPNALTDGGQGKDSRADDLSAPCFQQPSNIVTQRLDTIANACHKCLKSADNGQSRGCGRTPTPWTERHRATSAPSWSKTTGNECCAPSLHFESERVSRRTPPYVTDAPCTQITWRSWPNYNKKSDDLD